MFQNIERQIGRQVTRDDMELMTGRFIGGLDISGMEYSKVASSWDRYAYQMAQLHEQYDLLLLPTVAKSAPGLNPYELFTELTSKLMRIDEFTKTRNNNCSGKCSRERSRYAIYSGLILLVNQRLVCQFTAPKRTSNWCATRCSKRREDLLLQIAEWFE